MQTNTRYPKATRRRRPDRRGVSSILAMMFVVIFGSLAAAMAVVAQGNLRTASSAIQVSRAMSAAETGLVFAQRRLASESRRFVVDKGEIDGNFAEKLWLGTYSSGDGAVEVLDPDDYDVETNPDGLIEAVRDAHLADSHAMNVAAGDSSLPSIDNSLGILKVKPIAMTDAGADGPFFRLKYELLEDEPMVRVTSTGYDGEITRSLQMDFRLDKRIEFALLSPNRIMIGKNVRIEGPLGSRYGLVNDELNTENGDPLVLRSDFYYLSDALDTNLDTLYTAIRANDVDGDNRLRPDHPTEGLGTNDGTLSDYNGDEYVDDFDLFLAAFDDNSDLKVVYDEELAGEVGFGSLSAEFDVDLQMARLIDEYRPDRNGDGKFTIKDRKLGYKDGILDSNDFYAKVHGEVKFAVAEAAWEAEHGESYQTVVEGPIDVDIDEAPIEFEVGEDDMREITTDMFSDAATWFDTTAQSNFATQVQNQIDAGTATFTVHSGSLEAVPYGSAGAYDYYARDTYEDFVFNNVRIPMGNNGLFVNCTFKGVTFVEAAEDNDHENWNFAGVWLDDTGTTLKYPGVTAEMDGEDDPIEDTRVFSNNIRFHNCTFLGSLTGDKCNEYAQVRNKIQMTGTTRFYIDPEDTDLATQDDAGEIQSILSGYSAEAMDQLQRSSMLLPGWSVDVGSFDNETAEDHDDTPKIKLKGTIVAGILDVRGTADVHGTLLMTYRPIASTGALFYGAMPDMFNTTIGYFGPDDGDGEGLGPDDDGFPGFGEITLRYDPDAKLPDGIPWPVSIDPEPYTYTEGGG